MTSPASASSPSVTDDAPVLIAPLRRRLMMALVTGALFMEILDGTILTTALPAMARTFHTSAVALDIGISAYLLALGVLIPASGWLADRFGARSVFAAAIAIFTIASALCGQAQSVPEFVALRVLQGVGGAMMTPVGRLVVMRHTPRDQLIATLSALIWPALFAPVVGPPIGGLITEHLGWRWIFWFNVPIGAVALAAALWLIPDVRGVQRRFDWPGFGLVALGVVLLQIGLERCARAVEPVALTLVGGGLAVLALAVAHLRRSERPLIDLGALAIPTFRVAVGPGLLIRMAIGAVPFLLPLMMQAGFGFSPVHAGLFVVALFAGDITMKSLVERILRRFGHRPVLMVNGLVAVASLLSLAVITPAMPTLAIAALLYVNGLTRSLEFSTLSTLAFADIGQEAMSDANGLFNTLLQLGAAAGVTVAAMCVHAGARAAGVLGIDGSGADYRFAFVAMALVALAGLLGAWRLPADAGRALTEARA